MNSRLKGNVNSKFILGLGMIALLGINGGLSAQEAEVVYEVTPLSGTLTMLKARGGNIAVSAGDDGVYLIDDQYPNIADQLIDQVRKLSDKPIRFVINTHYHGDHTGGNEALGGQGAVIIAHDNIRQRMSSDQFNNFMNSTTAASSTAALPVITFNETVTLHLNGESAIVHHVPRGHTDGDAIVHFPVSNVIHMGDIFFNGLYPFIDLDGGGSVQGMIAAMDKALTMANESTQVIPGHGPLSTTDDLRSAREMLSAAAERVQVLIDEGADLEAAIAAKPTAEWDETLGNAWITPAQFVTFIYNSLTGVEQFTRIPSNSGS